MTFAPMKVPPWHRFASILAEDPRYAPAAYDFVFEGLTYAHDRMGLGASSSEEEDDHHVTGQQLCEAIRLLALEQFGLMARTVLEGWGVRSTSDIGEIVYNLIRAGLMKKTDQDEREDFNDVWDFATDLTDRYEIEPPSGDE